MEYRIQRIKENDKIIIYRRLFNLDNCCGDLRYFEFNKQQNEATGKQFKSITQVNKYLTTN